MRSPMIRRLEKMYTKRSTLSIWQVVAIVVCFALSAWQW